MAKEIEAKFLNIDKQKVISKLEAIGAVKIHDEKLLRRCAYNLPIPIENSWVRIRDEGDKVTMSFKRVKENTIYGMEEIEIIINDFELGRNFLNAIGLVEKAFQETMRIRYVIPTKKVVFDIDTWPALNPFIEIESVDEATVKHFSKSLGFTWEDRVFGSVDTVYVSEYKITKNWIVNLCPRLKFDNLPLQLLPDNKRN